MNQIEKYNFNNIMYVNRIIFVCSHDSSHYLAVVNIVNIKLQITKLKNLENKLSVVSTSKGLLLNIFNY